MFSLFSFDYIMGRVSLQEIASAFIVLFAVIDIFGSTPVIISLRNQGRPVSAWKASSLSFALMLGFFIAGDAMLKLFNVDIQSFAIAGALILFFMSLEMILDITIFKNMGPIKEATLVPVVFPLIAGAGSFTTLLSLKAEYASLNIVIALALNCLFVFIVISAIDWVERKISPAMIYLLRKFFGIILLAISVRLFTSNILPLISELNASAQ